VPVQVYNNNLTSSIWKNYTTNAAHLRGSVALLANGLKSNQAQDPTEISLGQARRLKYRDISAAASATESQINHLQTTAAWLQKAQTILEEMSALVTPADEASAAGDQQAQIPEALAMMRNELERIKSMNDGRMLAGDPSAAATSDAASETPPWFKVMSDPNLAPAAEDGAGQIASAARNGIADLTEQRKAIGDNIQQLELALAELRSQVANIRATENRIRDPESARTTTEAAKGAILTQVGTAMLAQANTLPGSVMNLTTPAAG